MEGGGGGLNNDRRLAKFPVSRRGRGLRHIRMRPPGGFALLSTRT